MRAKVLSVLDAPNLAGLLDKIINCNTIPSKENIEEFLRPKKEEKKPSITEINISAVNVF